MKHFYVNLQKIQLLLMFFLEKTYEHGVHGKIEHFPFYIHGKHVTQARRKALNTSDETCQSIDGSLVRLLPFHRDDQGSIPGCCSAFLGLVCVRVFPKAKK